MRESILDSLLKFFEGWLILKIADFLQLITSATFEMARNTKNMKVVKGEIVPQSWYSKFICQPENDDEIVVTAICCSTSRLQYYKNSTEKSISAQRSKEIDAKLQQDMVERQKTMNILLLGCFEFEFYK